MGGENRDDLLGIVVNVMFPEMQEAISRIAGEAGFAFIIYSVLLLDITEIAL